MKKTYIEELREGERFDDLFLVKSTKLGETRAGKPYLVLTLMDKSGEVSGPIWDDAEAMHARCEVGKVVRCNGLVQRYRDQVQLKFDQVTGVKEEHVDLRAFLPSSVRCRQEMAGELQKLVRSVKNHHLKILLNHFFNKSDWWPRFQNGPAAKNIHHAYIGGLLEHSLSVATLADSIAAHYPGVDRCLLISGALLHDIGKLEELVLKNGVVDYSVSGRLKGHLVIGSELVEKTAMTIRDFPKPLLTQLQHLILSHHGRLEFGSPAVPMTVEAFILNLIDDLDAKMNLIEQLRRKMQSEEMTWTEYQRTLERYLYLGGFRQSTIEEVEEDKATSHQPTLF